MKKMLQRMMALSLVLMLFAGSAQALTLRYNQRGDDVKTLQKALKQLGFYDKSLDGIYGSGTRTAVREFQMDYGLSVDGVAGPKTLEKIEELTGIEVGGESDSGAVEEEETPSNGKGLFGGVYTTIEYGDKGSRVKTLQQALDALGYEIGKIDGSFGSRTYVAVREFQRSEMLSVDGKAGKKTLTRMETYFDENGNLNGSTNPPVEDEDEEEEDTPDYAIPTRTLRYGASGDDVKYTQQRLRELGYYTGSLDGKFGTGMLTAVKAFQKKNGLSADGVVGSKTIKLLFSDDALGEGEEEEEEFRTLRYGMEGPDVGALQLRLKDLGYYGGTADGVFGNGTLSAVAAFQLRNGLTASGVCDEATAKVLYSDSAQLAEDEMEFRTLRYGMEGEDVEELQERLIDLKYLSGSAHGTYDVDTVLAVAEFQRRNGLDADGIFDERTCVAVYSINAIPKEEQEEDEEDDEVVIPDTTLQMGQSGEAIADLQRRLKELGYYAGTVDGDFGASTYAAVKAFQTRNGLNVDGKAGKYTLSLLYSDDAISADDEESQPEEIILPTRILRQGMSGDDVKLVQTRLQELGYYTGELHGNFDKKTLLAVRAFQQNNNLLVDGAAGPNTNTLLFSEKAIGAPADTSIIPTRDLSLGDTGEDVKAVQQRLRNLGFYTSQVDGTYGSSTTSAMFHFQEMNGLTATGNGDLATYAKLFSDDALNDEGVLWGTDGPDYKNLKLGSTGTDVIRLQQKLRELKYDVSVTGTYDAQTKAAVIKFQKLNNLSADGIAGKATQTRVYSGYAVTGDVELPEDGDDTGEGVVPTVPTGNGGGPDVSEVKWLMWYDEVKPQLGSADILLVYEPKSNTSYRIRVYARGKHLDAEPYTIQDTALMKAAWGGEFSWNEKPVYVRLPSGVWCIASTHSMPHEENGITTNGFVGHLCVHFPRTMQETIAAGDTKNGVRHQNDIRKHWLAITGENITW